MNMKQVKGRLTPLLISRSFFSVIYFKVHSTKIFKIAFEMRSSLFWDATQRRVAASYYTLFDAA
jgi:hypothetical protein